MSRMKASKIPRRPPRRGQPPGNTSPPPPAPDLPTRDSSRKSFEREPNWLWKHKNSEQNLLQWWWYTKLDSNDRGGFQFFWMMMGAPLFIMVHASGYNILLVILQIAWAIWVLYLGYCVTKQAITELTDEYRDSIDNSSVQDNDVDRERGTDHTTGW